MTHFLGMTAIGDNVKALKKYIQFTRLNQPTGSLLILWPCLWALWIASKGHPSLLLIIIFMLGAFVMHALASVIDDIADRSLDLYVQRTQYRLLTSKKISLQEAFAILFFLMLCAFVLALFLNMMTIGLSCIALFLAFIYPFTKRMTDWPQFFLGLAASWAVPMAFAAQLNHLPEMTWLVFLISVLWVMLYDTLYALMDRSDDERIGVRSTAVLFSKKIHTFLLALQSAILLLLIGLGLLTHLSTHFYYFLIAVASLFIYQHYLVKCNKVSSFLNAYRSNAIVGFLIYLGIMIGYL